MRLNRALVGLGVVAAHMLLLSLLWTIAHQALPNRSNKQATRPDRSPSIVFLLEPNAPAAIKPRRDAPHPDAQRAQADPKRDTAVPTPVYGSEVSNAAALSNAASVPLTTGGASAEVPKQSGSSLNLTLSPEALKSLAAPGLASKSPFHGRLPATMESKIAEAAAETGPWTEEVIDHDHIRYRRGTTCITSERPEIAKIDPFSNWARNVPWLRGRPTECH
jgi:hypothetical protein